MKSLGCEVEVPNTDQTNKRCSRLQYLFFVDMLEIQSHYISFKLFYHRNTFVCRLLCSLFSARPTCLLLLPIQSNNFVLGAAGFRPTRSESNTVIRNRAAPVAIHHGVTSISCWKPSLALQATSSIPDNPPPTTSTSLTIWFKSTITELSTTA